MSYKFQDLLEEVVKDTENPDNKDKLKDAIDDFLDFIVGEIMEDGE